MSADHVNFVYDVFVDAFSSHAKYKSKKVCVKYENRQKPVILGKKWPYRCDNFRILVIQLPQKKILNDNRTIFPRHFPLAYQI